MTNPKEALEWYERKQVEARAMADRDCKSCKHNKPDGCSRWDCEYEPVMSDLISRADAIDTVEELTRKVNDGTGYGTICTPDVLRRINALPSADAVEVVRCKDCKHRHEDECPMQFEEQFDIDEGDGYYDTEYIIHDYTRDDGFCSWGERSEP